jgi:hypothetical protein
MEIVCTKLLRTWPEKDTPKGGTLYAWQAEITVDTHPANGEQKVKTFDAALAAAFEAGQPVPAVEDAWNGNISYKLQGKVRGGARPPQQQQAPANAPVKQGTAPAYPNSATAESNPAPARGNRDDSILAQCCFKGAIEVITTRISTVCDQSYTDKVGAAEVLALTSDLFDGMKLIVEGKRVERTAHTQPIPQDDTPF